MTPDIPHEISGLSNREADRLLDTARRARLAAINQYWTLCRADPTRARRVMAGAAPILADLFELARSAFRAPRPGTLDGLSRATARLLRVQAIRDALPDTSPLPADPADAFWEDGRVVALRMAGGVRAVVARYDGPLFNPGTVPEGEVASGHDWRIVCQGACDGNGAEYAFLTAYAIGSMSDNGDWTPVRLDLASRSDLERDLPAMETLVESGHLAWNDRDAFPLPAFVTDSDRLIAQLQAHKARLRQQGTITPAQQAIVDRRTRPLYALAARLRRRMDLLENALYRIRRKIARVEACALEEETGFARGDRVRHRFTGDEGALEIVNFGGAAQFRLAGTRIYVTEDIRRGEWEKTDETLPATRD